MSDGRIGDLVEAAYLDGYRRGVEAFAWWKDGQQLVGSGILRLEQALRSAPEDAKELYRGFLERQREKFEERRGE